jgi:hypothetical protein
VLDDQSTRVQHVQRSASTEAATCDPTNSPTMQLVDQQHGDTPKNPKACQGWYEGLRCEEAGATDKGRGAHHLIGQYAVQLLLVEAHQPVQTDVLVLPQLVLQQERRLQKSQPTLKAPAPAVGSPSSWLHLLHDGQPCVAALVPMLTCKSGRQATNAVIIVVEKRSRIDF